MKLSILALLIATVVSGCSSTVEIKKETAETKRVPTWYMDYADTGSETRVWYKPWARDGYFYAVAEDVSPSMEMSLRKATLKAKAKIADRVTGELTNRTTIKYTEVGSPENPIGQAQAQDLLVNLIAETALQTYGTVKKEVLYNPELRNYRSFIMLKISRSDIDRIANQYHQNQQARINSKFAGQDIEQVARDLLKQ